MSWWGSRVAKMRFALEKRNLMVLSKHGYPHAVAQLQRDYHARVATYSEIAALNQLHQNVSSPL